MPSKHSVGINTSRKILIYMGRPLANAGDMGSIPGLGRHPGEGNGNPLQYSCLRNLIDRGAWQAIVHGVAKGQTQLSD